MDVDWMKEVYEPEVQQIMLWWLLGYAGVCPVSLVGLAAAMHGGPKWARRAITLALGLASLGFASLCAQFAARDLMAVATFATLPTLVVAGGPHLRARVAGGEISRRCRREPRSFGLVPLLAPSTGVRAQRSIPLRRVVLGTAARSQVLLRERRR